MANIARPFKAQIDPDLFFYPITMKSLNIAFMIGVMLTIGIPILGHPDNSPDSIDHRPSISMGDKGWLIESADGNFTTHAQLRLQLRYSYPFEQDPQTLDVMNSQVQHILQILRARVKIGGHAFTPKLKYYFEYDVASSSLLDFWGAYKVNKGFNIMAGQYKARFNGERVISSGEQQFVERSIITRPFTLDRQAGITLFGNLHGEGSLNFSYWAAVLTGLGRGSYVPDDDAMMWMFRGQWNMFGEVMPFSGSDLERSKRWRGYLAGGVATNRSQFTRFSSSGGGQLGAYENPSLPGQYRTNQWFVETAFKRSGFSWQQEFHWKMINDLVNLSDRLHLGTLVQLGSFPSTYLSLFPESLEFAARYAFYLPDYPNPDNQLEEVSFVINWFFSGHRNKLSAETSWLELEDAGILDSRWRFRLQWEVSF